MSRRPYDREMYDKMNDMIELIYILNRLSNNSYIDNRSKQYLIGMLNDVESIKSNFDKYRIREPLREPPRIGCNKCEGCYPDKGYGSGGFVDKILFFLKSLND